MALVGREREGEEVKDGWERCRVRAAVNVVVDVNVSVVCVCGEVVGRRRHSAREGEECG
jgi:hypothetical protein